MPDSKPDQSLVGKRKRRSKDLVLAEQVTTHSGVLEEIKALRSRATPEPEPNPDAATVTMPASGKRATINIDIAITNAMNALAEKNAGNYNLSPDDFLGVYLKKFLGGFRDKINSGGLESIKNGVIPQSDGTKKINVTISLTQDQVNTINAIFDPLDMYPTRKNVTDAYGRFLQQEIKA